MGVHPMHREELALLVDPSAALAATRSTADALVRCFQLYSSRRCLGARMFQVSTPGRYGEYEWMSYAETFDAAMSFGAGLCELLDTETEAPLVGVLGAVCVDWMLSDYGCALKGLGVVLMHRATSPVQLGHILQTTEMRVLIISRHLRHILANAVLSDDSGSKAPSLQHIVWLDDPEDAHAAAVAANRGGRWHHLVSEHQWADVAQIGSMLPATIRLHVVQEVNDEAIVKLLPSSGTTGGTPKLTVCTERALRDKVRSTSSGLAAGSSLAGTVVVFAYEAMRQSVDVLLQGGSIGFFSGSLARIQEDCQRLRPTAFAATPTFWTGLQAEFEAEVRRRSSVDSDATTHGAKGTVEEHVLLEWMDRRILGNRLQILVSTGAPLAHRVNRWLFRVFGRTIVNAYGTTETGGLCSNESVSAGAEIRLVDCPQLGYTTADKPHPRGEILAHTPRVAGYFEQGCRRLDGTFDATKGSSEEWVTLGGVRYFRTGDIGELLGKGQIRVIDRCKSYFKLSHGVFVAPQCVEQALQESAHVRQIWIYGESTMNAVTAVVVVPEGGSVGKDEEVRVLKSLRLIGVAASLKAWEIPQRVVLESEPFTELNGLVASGGKLCRPALIQRYRAQLECGFSTVKDRCNAADEVPEEAYSASPAGSSLDALCAGLVEVLREVTPQASLLGQESTGLFASTSSLVALGLDSIGIARLSSRLEETFGVPLPPRILYSLPTLGDLESAIFGGDAAVRRAAMRADMIDWNHEVEIASEALRVELNALHEHANSMPQAFSVSESPPRPDTVLLTGASGFLGAFLLRALVEDDCPLSCRRIVCIVRAQSDAAAESRLSQCMETYGLEYDSSRVSVLAGDLEESQLGLQPKVYFKLVARLKLVLHCGARVSSAMPYRALHDVNVGGTRRALSLAILGSQTTDFVHVSTMGFLPLGHAETRAVSVANLLAQTGYAQSKFVAEQLVTAAAASREYAGKTRIRIVRPGVVCGDSVNGVSNLKDATSMLLGGLVQEGVCCTDSQSPIPQLFNLCPVDYVAAAIVRIAAVPWEQHEAEFPSAAFHLCARQSITLSELCEWVRQAGYELTEVSARTFCSRVRNINEDHPLFALKSMLCQPISSRLHDNTSMESTRFSTSLAEACLHSLHNANGLRSGSAKQLPTRSMTAPALGKAIVDLLTRSGRRELVDHVSRP